MNILRNDQIQSEVLNISEECARQTDMMEASYAGMSRPSNIPWAVPVWLPPPPGLPQIFGLSQIFILLFQFVLPFSCNPQSRLNCEDHYHW